jgi:ADP-ribosylglycohydrolase
MDAALQYRGCLIGLAVGDAVGTALEFKRPGSFGATKHTPSCLHRKRRISAGSSSNGNMGSENRGESKWLNKSVC